MKYITITIALLSLSLLQSCGNKKFASDLKRTHQSTAVDTNGCTAVKKSVNESNHQDYLYKGSIIDSAYRKYISYWKSRDSAELNVLKKTDGAVFRPEPTILAIKTDVGDTVYYIDWCVASANEPLYGELYHLEDYLPAFKLCVLTRSEPEMTQNDFVFIETGERDYNLPGLPQISPDGRRFITCSEDDQGMEGIPSGFIIWEKRGKSIAKVYEKKWGRTIAKWIDNSRIALERSLNVNLEDNESQVFILDTLVYSQDNWYHETDGKCITSENKTPFAVKDLGDNYEEGVKYVDPYQVNYKVAVLKKTPCDETKQLIDGAEKNVRILRYARRLKNPFMYVRLCAIENLGLIEDDRAVNALLDFISSPENYKEDGLSVDFACLALKSSKAPVEEMILDRLQRHIEATDSSYERYLSDSVSWAMLFFWQETATAGSLTFLDKTENKWPYSYRNFVDSALVQIERKLKQPAIPAQDSSEVAMQSNRKIGLEDIFNRIVDLITDNAGMEIHYSPVDKKLLDTLILETDQNVHAAAKKILESVDENNLWASRFLILRSCLNSQNKRLRIWAIEKLAEEETWHSHALVKRAFDDQDEDVRSAAATALKRKLFRP